MPYMIYCLDLQDAGDLRKRTRAAHLEYMIAHQDKVLYGGPLQSDDGTRVLGSLMVLSLKTRDEVDAFLETEPYTQARLFSETRIARLRQMVPEHPPGLLQSELAQERKTMSV